MVAVEGSLKTVDDDDRRLPNFFQQSRVRFGCGVTLRFLEQREVEEKSLR